MKIRLTANAGAFIETDGGAAILIDALHKKGTRYYSGVGEDMLREITDGRGIFSHIDLMLVTHAHPDHYDEQSVLRFAHFHPETAILTPTGISAGNVVNLASAGGACSVGGLHIRYRRIAHEGPEYAGVVNYGYVVGAGGPALMFLGDGKTDFDAVGGFMGGETIGTAFLTFPFVTLARGRRIINDIIKPERVVVFHLPSAADDPNGFVASTLRAAERYSAALPPTHILYDENPFLDV